MLVSIQSTSSMRVDHCFCPHTNHGVLVTAGGSNSSLSCFAPLTGDSIHTENTRNDRGSGLVKCCCLCNDGQSGVGRDDGTVQSAISGVSQHIKADNVQPSGMATGRLCFIETMPWMLELVSVLAFIDTLCEYRMSLQDCCTNTDTVLLLEGMKMVEQTQKALRILQRFFSFPVSVHTACKGRDRGQFIWAGVCLQRTVILGLSFRCSDIP